MGGYKDDRRHGKGALQTMEGKVIYEGEWRDGRFDGQGAKLYSRGGGYKGTWAEGKRHGVGTMKYPNKDEYTGALVPTADGDARICGISDDMAVSYRVDGKGEATWFIDQSGMMYGQNAT